MGMATFKIWLTVTKHNKTTWWHQFFFLFFSCHRTSSFSHLWYITTGNLVNRLSNSHPLRTGNFIMVFSSVDDYLVHVRLWTKSIKVTLYFTACKTMHGILTKVSLARGLWLPIYQRPLEDAVNCDHNNVWWKPLADKYISIKLAQPPWFYAFPRRQATGRALVIEYCNYRHSHKPRKTNSYVTK